MAKKRKSASSSDAIERKLDMLTAAVLRMMSERGQGAAQTYRDFSPEDAFEYPSPQMFSENLAGDTVMEGPITDYAAEAAGGRSAMSQNVAGRAGDKYMQDVYRLILANMRQGGGAAGRRVR